MKHRQWPGRPWRLALVFLLFTCGVSWAGSIAAEVPGAGWRRLERPAEHGWSTAKLEAAWRYAEEIGTVAVLVAHRGAIAAEWGATTRRFNVHSIRKSLLSALYGIEIAAGRIAPGATLAALGIDDVEPRLTPTERGACVGDLLRARSGVYHPALYETAAMRKRRPARGSHVPGAFWYYNNWDFNALGTIYEQCTGRDVFHAFRERIAAPIAMQDLRPEDTRFIRGADSSHPAYEFRMSARDLARFGLLYCRGGRWGATQVVPADWVGRSTTAASPAPAAGGGVHAGYGLMWWTDWQGAHLPHVDLPPGTFSARGSGGHYVVVVPAWDLVVVHRVDTDIKEGARVERDGFGRLLCLLLDAMPAEDRPLAPANDPGPADCLPRALDRLVPALMTKHRVPGVGIVGIENRHVLFERQYGVMRSGASAPVNARTLFEAASMSKPVAAYAALKLVEQGRLDLDRPLAAYLDTPYLADAPRHLKITARMVLAHTTGFPNWRKGGLGGGGPLPVLHDPGTRFTYSGEGFTYLQRVMERITDAPFDAHIERALLRPVGFERGGYTWRDEFERFAASGHDARGVPRAARTLYRAPNAAYSLYCTPTDYALFVVEMLRADRSAAHSLSARSLGAMLTRTVEVPTREPIIRRGVPPSGSTWRGLGWAIDACAGDDRIQHSGANGTGFRCYCEFDPKRGSGIVIMTNGDGGTALWRELIDAVGGG